MTVANPSDDEPTSTETTVTRIAVAPSRIVGGDPGVGLVDISNAAPEGGAIVTLGSQYPDVLSVPPTLTIPAGASNGSFPVATFEVQAEIEVQVWAELGVAGLAVGIDVIPKPKLTCRPPYKPPAVECCEFAPNYVQPVGQPAKQVYGRNTNSRNPASPVLSRQLAENLRGNDGGHSRAAPDRTRKLHSGSS